MTIIRAQLDEYLINTPEFDYDIRIRLIDFYSIILIVKGEFNFESI